MFLEKRVGNAQHMRLLALLLAGLGLIAGPAAVPAHAAAPAVTAATIAQEKRVVQLVNLHRARAGCPALRVDARLVRAARGHSQDMARRNYFSHTTPGGTTAPTRIAKQGYPRGAYAENIAAGTPNGAATVNAWMRSPGHRANILRCSLRAVGVGLARGGRYGTYWTMDLGAR